MKSTSIWLTLLAAMTTGGFFAGKGCKSKQGSPISFTKFQLNAESPDVEEIITPDFNMLKDEYIKNHRTKVTTAYSSAHLYKRPDTSNPLVKVSFEDSKYFETDYISLKKYLDTIGLAPYEATHIRFYFTQIDSVQKYTHPKLNRMAVKTPGQISTAILGFRKQQGITQSVGATYDIMTLCPYDCN